MERRFTVYCPFKLSPDLNEKVERWARMFGKPKSQVIRALIIGAKAESFPKSWQIADEEKELLAAIEGVALAEGNRNDDGDLYGDDFGGRCAGYGIDHLRHVRTVAGLAAVIRQAISE
jgi:hypothetical protein